MTFGTGTFGVGTFGAPVAPVAPWTPGDTWPSSTPGGAWSPFWGGYVRLYVRAALAAGNAFHMGAHTFDRLDAGNVLAGGELAGRAAGTDRLWVDLACDVIDLELAGGASTSQGILSKADAATLVLTLADPTGKYDPLNAASPFAYGGRSRLIPGTPVEVFAEVVNGDSGAWWREPLFVGTVDSWAENWTPHPSKREAKIVATDETKVWARYNRPEQAPAGAGDTTRQRVERLVAFYAWLGAVEHAAASTATLAATTLAQPGWELLNRTLDDELGYVYFTADGALRWINRASWLTITPPIVVLGCETVDANARDVLVEAHATTLDSQMRNAIYAARTGGTTQTASSPSSIERHGEYDYKRTDLGHDTDAGVAAWAQTLLMLYAYPAQTLDDVTMRPALDARSWEVCDHVLDVDLVTDVVRVRWAPPDLPDNVVDALSRVVGYRHKITRHAWEVRWQLVAADALGNSGAVFHMGAHAQDRLDAGFVLGFT